MQLQHDRMSAVMTYITTLTTINVTTARPGGSWIKEWYNTYYARGTIEVSLLSVLSGSAGL